MENQTINPRIARAFFTLSMFITGAAGYVIECVLSTVSTYVLGNSIEQFTIIIAIMMGFMGVGSYVQKQFSGNLVEKFIFVEALLAIVGGFAPITIYAAYGHFEMHFAFIQYFFASTIGLLIGFEIPLILRINKEFTKSLKHNVAIVASADYIGSFIGAILYVKFLLKAFPITEVSFIVAATNFVVAAITFAYFTKHKFIKRKALSFSIIGVVLFAVGFGFMKNRDWNMNLAQRLYDHPIVGEFRSPYQDCKLTYEKSRDDSRLYLNGNLQFSSADENIYHEQLVYPVMELAEKRKSVLILGGGDGLAAMRILKFSGVEKLVMVDLDPKMIEFSSTNPVMTKLNQNVFGDARMNLVTPNISPGELQKVYYKVGTGEEKIDSLLSRRERKKLKEAGELYVNSSPQIMFPTKEMKMSIKDTIRVFNVDADNFIKAIDDKFDIIIIDLPDPNCVELAKLYSLEFYLKLHRVLKDKGLFVVQSTSPYHAKEAYLCIKNTIEKARFKTLPYHDNVPSFGEWGWILGWNDYAYTQDEIKEKINKLNEFSVESTYLTPDLFRASLAFGKNDLIPKKEYVSTLMSPTVYTLYEQSWKGED